MNESKEKKALLKTKKNIGMAIKDETDDIKEYQKSAKMAKKVGDKLAARTFKSIEKDEKEHRSRLKKLKNKY